MQKNCTDETENKKTSSMRLISKKILDKLEVLALHVSHLILLQDSFARLFQGFSSVSGSYANVVHILVFLDLIWFACFYDLHLFYINNPFLTIALKIVKAFLKDLPKNLFSDCLVGLLTYIL